MHKVKAYSILLAGILSACAAENSAQNQAVSDANIENIVAAPVETFDDMPASFADWERAEQAGFWTELSTSGYTKRSYTGFNPHISNLKTTKQALGEIDYIRNREIIAGQTFVREPFSRSQARSFPDIKNLGSISVIRGNFLRKKEWLSFLSVVISDDNDLIAIETSEIDLTIISPSGTKGEASSMQAQTFNTQNDYGQRVYLDATSSTIAIFDKRSTASFEMNDVDCFNKFSNSEDFTKASEVCGDEIWSFDAYDRLRLFYFDLAMINQVKSDEGEFAKMYSVGETLGGVEYAIKTLKRNNNGAVRAQHLKKR